MKGLIHDISETGYIEAIVILQIGEDYEIINGHRRAFAATYLKLDQVPCDLIDDKTVDPTKLYIALNTQLKLNGNHKLYIMRKAGDRKSVV